MVAVDIAIADKVWPQVRGEVSECRDGEVWEELRWLFEERVDGVVEAAQVGIWGAGHGGVCMCYAEYVL